MIKASREFQVFVKPVGPVCNLDCHYCYYLKKEALYPGDELFRMSDAILEKYIRQHIHASSGPVIFFSWHGGEPVLSGLNFFRKIVSLQRKHKPANQRILNGMQTNGTLLDENWCRFLAAEKFIVGISLDGPPDLHNLYRLDRAQKPSFDHAIRGYKLLRDHGVISEILCVVNAQNVMYPLQIYRYFKQLDAKYVSFLPLVEAQPDARGIVSLRTVPSELFGKFLCAIFDEWKALDIGKIKVQIFEEAIRTAFGQEHSLCIFRKTCGGVPVLEHNGDFFSCDHFVDTGHHLGNILNRPFVEMLESPEQISFGQVKLNSLPQYCLKCEVRDMCNGGCPKDRLILTPDGEAGLNYLCAGFKLFFTHCRPFVNEVSELWSKQNSITNGSSLQTRAVSRHKEQIKTGRNNPCPCGSGKKYKNCCMLK